MCNKNEIPPTPEEMQNITSGFKVFYDRFKDGNLYAPFAYYKIGNDWMDARDSDEGFHVFISKEVAERYLDALTHGFAYKDQLTVKEVQIKDIIAIGQIDDGCYGDDVSPTHSVFRCKQIKLALNHEEKSRTEEKQ